jgi:hypothetical protein
MPTMVSRWMETKALLALEDLKAVKKHKKISHELHPKYWNENSWHKFYNEL